MGPSKNRDIDGYSCRIGFIQPDSKISFSTQQQEYEDPNMHQTHSTLVSSGLIQMVQDRRQNVQYVTGFENKEQKLFVVFAKLPKEYQKFLVKLNLSLRIGQVGMSQWIHQQSGNTFVKEGAFNGVLAFRNNLWFVDLFKGQLISE